MWGWGLGIVERRRFGSGVVCLGRARVGEARQVLAGALANRDRPCQKDEWRVASGELEARSFSQSPMSDIA